MDRMLVVVFDNEKKASEGYAALQKLDTDGAVIKYASAVVLKHADGTVSVKNEDIAPPLATITGTILGTFIGLLGGPMAPVIGASAGLALGGFLDIDNARVGEDFVEDVSRTLTPNKVALVAEVNEGETKFVDERMEALGGIVIRRALSQVHKTVNKEKIAAMKADMASFKAEMKEASAERRKRLQAKIDILDAKIHARQERDTEGVQTRVRLENAKRELFKRKASAAGRALKELANTPL
ncbi:MAG TPA: DUF1269 domain-containing protein [Thermoanaerobaculia bacterium]|nr:DUF1269 domain-containing protein [Thermoanaerobaculia bacterium]